MEVLQPTLNTVYNLNGWPGSARFRLVDIFNTKFCKVKPANFAMRGKREIIAECADLREIEHTQNKAYERS
jgi:hypothetical protein